MKARRTGAGLLGVAFLLAVLPAPTTPAPPDAAAAPERRAVQALDGSSPVAAAVDPGAVAPKAAAGTTTGAASAGAGGSTLAAAAPAAGGPAKAVGAAAPATACPVAGPVEFVDSWGFRRSGGRRHQGVDMLAARGTPVVAPVAGTVEHRGNAVGGRSYHLLADDGTWWYGTHLDAYGASGRVEAGTVIGYVGDSGNARGTPHLHLEIHPGGEGSPAVDPFPAVSLLCLDPAAA